MGMQDCVYRKTDDDKDIIRKASKAAAINLNTIQMKKIIKKKVI